MWPFRIKSVETLVRKKDISGLLDIIVAKKKSIENRLNAALWLKEFLNIEIQQGHSLSSLGVLTKLNNAKKIATTELNSNSNPDDSEMYTAICLSIILYTLRDPDAKNFMKELLINTESKINLFNYLVRLEDPEVINLFFFLIPIILKEIPTWWDTFKSHIIHFLESADKKKDYSTQYLIPLIFDMQITNYWILYDIIEKYIKPFLHPKTTEERILAALISQPVNENAIDLIGKEAIPVLQKFLTTQDTTLIEVVLGQLKRLKVSLTNKEKALMLMVENDIFWKDKGIITSETIDVLLPYIQSYWDGHWVREVLINTADPKAAGLILKYYADQIDHQYSSYVIDVGARMEAIRGFQEAAKAFGTFAISHLKKLADMSVEHKIIHDEVLKALKNLE